SETAMHLNLQRQRFVEVYRETYGLAEVKDVRFQAGRLTAKAGEQGSPDAAPPEPDPAEVASLVRAVEEARLPGDTAAVARAGAPAAAPPPAGAGGRAPPRAPPPGAAPPGPATAGRAGAAAPPPAATAAAPGAAARTRASPWARHRAAGHAACPTCGVLHDGA